MIFKRKKTTENKYKFKSLKVYASEEWLAEGKKKYRQVFEKSETGYLYAELAFYNKFFDKADWELNVKLICYRITREGKEVMCDLNLNQKIHSEENTVYIREGWGHEEAGYFWNKGEYIWEAFLDNELVGTSKFYIEDGGSVTSKYNPYFELVGVRLFEGANDGVTKNERVYLKAFQATETRYIWVEFKIDNMLTFDWYCELKFNFYNITGQLKGSTSELQLVASNEEEVRIITGWGSDNKGTWYENQYTLEVVFMDQLIAIIPFTCGLQPIEGQCRVLVGDELIINTALEDDVLSPENSEANKPKETLEGVMEELTKLIGLEDIKDKIKDYSHYLEFLKIRKEKGFEENEKINLHAVFTGNPGTGKTTVAKLLGRVYHQLGFLSIGNVVEVGRAELIGQYIGQTAPKVKEMIESARGGVLFIDEAYSLVRAENDDKDYGQEVIEVLVKEMSDGEGDIAVFLAGYPEEMKLVLDSNPGFKSRFGTTFGFPDYLPQELMSIAISTAKSKEINLEPEAIAILERKLISEYRDRDKSFGNARLVCAWIDEIKMKMGLRIMKEPNPKELSKEQLSTATKLDLESLFAPSKKGKPVLGIDEDELQIHLIALNEMVGLQKVKNEIHELIKLVRFYLDTQQDILGRFSLHAVFKGNPGTGKTIIARLLAKIYKSLGLLEKGHLVECTRKDLVAGYVGQTAEKTHKLVEKAKGGILFIDEAYALDAPGQQQDFGKEAIEVILREMEDHRGELAVIVAGYTKEIDSFMKMNPGLKSRFDKVLLFEDFSDEELYKITFHLLQQHKITPDRQAVVFIKSYFSSLKSAEKRYFGNAREVRRFVEQAVRNQHLRVSSLPASDRNEEVLKTLYLVDIQNISVEDNNQRAIGFSQPSR